MAPPTPARLTFSLNHDLRAPRALKASGRGTRYENTQPSDRMDTTAGNQWPVVTSCLTEVFVDRWFLSAARRFFTALQLVLWAALLWPCLSGLGVPLDCADEQGNLSRCSSISQEKLLDRVIQHAELIYRVSEESCSLFVSKRKRLSRTGHSVGNGSKHVKHVKFNNKPVKNLDFVMSQRADIFRWKVFVTEGRAGKHLITMMKADCCLK